MPIVNGAGIIPYTPNLIINGGFEVNQRAAVSVSASGGFPVDNWKIYAVGSTFVASQQAFTLGQTDVPGEPKNYLRCVVTTSPGASNYVRISKRIEGVRTLAGREVTFSWYGKADASKPVAIEFVQNFGTNGSPSADVNGIGAVKQITGNTFTKYSATITVPSISGKTIGTDGNDFLELLIWLDAGSTFNARTGSLGQQSGTFEFSNVKLEAGSVATPFIRKPFDLELERCQRLWEKTRVCSSYRITIYYQSESIIQFFVKKRTNPTITIYAKDSNTAGNMRDLTASSDVSASIIEQSESHVRVYATSGNLIADHQYGWYAVVDAEL